MGAEQVDLKGFVRRVHEQFPLTKAVLFGSRARGDHLRDSDYDLLLVSPSFAGIPFTDRMSAVYRLWPWDATLEPFCYTPEEFARKARQLTVVRGALDEGIDLTP
ncbi:MAG TPA: nucleotidyltransferase domain-containing protein [Limnochordia bacterium]